MNNFKQKTALITGAGLGIGFEIARQLAEQGASVLLNDIDADRASAAVEKIQETGGRCVALAGDAGDIGFIRGMVDRAVEEFGELDIAIANAGITTFGDFLDYEAEAFQTLIDVNLRGTFFLAQAAARQMKKQGKGGRILFTSSVTGIQAHPELAAYGMTKAGIQMLARALGAELGSLGITVNAIAPGATVTERTLENDPRYAETWSGMVPTGRACTPEDIAKAALFLCSPDAGQITGQTLVVDGGWTATSPSPDKFVSK